MVVKSARVTMIQTGCFAVVFIASIAFMWPNPDMELAVGIQMEDTSVIQVVVSDNVHIGIAAMHWCMLLQTGPLVVVRHPTYSRNLVVLRSSVPRRRLES